MPVFPLDGSRIVRPRRSSPERLGGVEHRERDAILDRAGRVLRLELREQADAGSGRQVRQLDERRVADRRGDPGAPQGVAELGGHRSPPAIAGRTITVAPSRRLVSRPSREADVLLST